MHSSPLHSKGVFHQAQFHSIRHWTLGKCCSAELVTSSKSWHTSLHNMKKMQSINAITDHIRKDLQYRETVKLSDYFFLKFWLLFYSETQLLSLATNILSCFSFKWQASLLIFEKKKKPAKCPSLNNHSWFGICSFKQKLCSKKKEASELTTQSHMSCSWPYPSHLGLQRPSLRVCRLVTQTMERVCL